MKFTYSAGDRPLDGYTIKEGLGRGGFGEVYRAISDGGKEVALKLVQRHLDVELRGVAQCLNLKHVNLMLLYDVRQSEGGDRWVVMEYMAGEALDKVIARHQQGMPLDRAVQWLRGICQGVGYLHERGIVHRDLKPGNIFLDSGILKIGDYGLSKFISASRRSGQTGSVGTVHYIAPEVIGGRYGKEVDLYAVGVMFYEMLTGRVPFEGESPAEVLMKHLAAKPDLEPVPAAFRPLIARLLEKDPRQRCPSVEELLADLDRALGGQPPVARIASVTPEAPHEIPDVRPVEIHPTLAPAYDSALPADRAEVSRLGIGFGLSVFNRMVGEPHYWRPIEVILRLLVAMFLGAGLGLSVAGGIIFIFGNNRRVAEEAAGFLGPGSGLLLVSIVLFALCSALRKPHRWWPMFASLVFGAGTALISVGALLLLMGNTRFAENVASFFGPGLGLLTAVLAAVTMYRAVGERPRFRLVLGLMLGAGVGLAGAGMILFLGQGSRSAENAAGFLGPGAGCLTAGIAIYLLYCSRLGQARSLHPSIPVSPVHALERAAAQRAQRVPH